MLPVGKSTTENVKMYTVNGKYSFKTKKIWLLPLGCGFLVS